MIALFIFSSFVADLSPFEFFRQETSNIDVVVREEAMRKLAVVAALMGPDKVRSEMLPYLQSMLNTWSIVLSFYMSHFTNFSST